MEGLIVQHFEDQARGCDELGSPFTASLCRLLAERLDGGSSFGRRLMAWRGDHPADAVALRACGALHALVRSGRAPELAAAYPPASFDAERLWTAIETALAVEDAFLAAWLDSPPQTNEVARSSVIVAAALTVADLTRLPLAVLEVGASAGLNLAFDRYRYGFGDNRFWGDANSPLTLTSHWRRDIPPLDAPLRVVSRSGCDRNPLDPSLETDAARLLAYVWADQAHRLQRLEQALGVASASGTRIAQADAAVWGERQLGRPPVAGTCRFLFHTIARQYLPEETKARLDAALQRAGAAATDEMPLAWFSFESDGRDAGGALTLTLWPAGSTLQLGRADYHGRWVEWQAP